MCLRFLVDVICVSTNVDDPGRLFDLLCRLGGVGIMQPESARALVVLPRYATGRDKRRHIHTHTHTFAYGQTDTATSTRSPRSRSFDFTRCLRVVHSKSRSQVLCLVQAVRSLAYVCVFLLCQICERTGHKQTHIHRRSNRLGQFFTVSVLSGFRLHNVSWRCLSRLSVCGSI